MERIISDEEKLRHAIEISQRRNNQSYQSSTRMNIKEKKDYKLFKKMVIQIIICLLIYCIFYLITSTDYVFSDSVIRSTTDILSYDIDLEGIYNNCKNFLETLIINENDNEKENAERFQNNIENNKEIKETSNELETIENIEENIVTEEVSYVKSQMELDAEEVKSICEFQKPLEGTITSEFGEREVTSKVMTADHKGIDIAAKTGTNIIAAMSGTVAVAEENSEYGKFIKIVNGNVMNVYAHCSELNAKVGDNITIGQTIAKVGSTGNSTGPHLHFEIRLYDRYINPRYVIEF